ncbi:MAG: branched-chain amino acid ABC transporter permease [Candidatus Abawacabacteria bacterium RIFCSPHIGHO2_01_FULL_46_8]|uniref:Branched-chain amino acid ABC transporter permease n=1 Tax=Candidatus Abawacabacteria bacterium RIFCSPHIGHO2_01_FULL_46_8 TaxID=1817815 RepID=A0A1F4XJ99_9BACT|nr:MAG: branched-chain amino acid ABC transporter permease [Candidatus Abawacabacteria bacterium RIFCSPHIGHO2_01_FULL_46_8]
MVYLEHLLVLIAIYAILAQSLNIALGYTGVFNLGHVAFYGIGAYTAALLSLSGYSFWTGLVVAIILAAIAGFILGAPTLRLRGHYLAIATLGFSEVVRAIMLNWSSLTRGPMGLPGIPRPDIFGWVLNSTAAYLIFAILVAVICNVLMWLIIHSHFGRVLRSIREDEIAALALGKNITKYKVQALMISAGFAAVAGVLYAHYINFIYPSTFVINEIVLILLMVVLGGMGSFKGAIVGAVIIILLPEPLRFLSLPSSLVGPLRQLIYALLLIVIMLFRPEGIIHPKGIKIPFVKRKS